MSKKLTYSLQRRQRTSGRPLKVLLPLEGKKIEEKNNASFIRDHRLNFLYLLRKAIHLPDFPESTWSGSALDLLFLTGNITSKMHRTAIAYTYFFRKNIYKAPKRCTAAWGADLIFFDRTQLKNQILHLENKKEDTHKESDKEFEDLWQRLSQALEKNNIKSCLDMVGPENDLQTAKNLICSQVEMQSFRKGLECAEEYIERFFRLHQYYRDMLRH